MPFTKLTTESELPSAGEAKEFDIAGKTICVANIDGTMCATDNVCLHEGGPLGQGYVDGNKLVCPWHGWEYDLRTGECLWNPRFRVRVYAVEVADDGTVIVTI